MKKGTSNSFELYIFAQAFLIWLRILNVIEWPIHAVAFPTYFFALELIAVTLWVIIDHSKHKNKEGG